MTLSQVIKMSLVGAVLMAASPAIAQQPPAPGASPRIDSIKKAGVLRVGVLANAPWLVENTKGGGEKWSGPAWVLANEYARLLGVKLEQVPVSHETKVPVLASNQVDMSITPLAETPDRLKVVDFVIYSTSASSRSSESCSNASLMISSLLGCVSTCSISCWRRRENVALVIVRRC